MHIGFRGKKIINFHHNSLILFQGLAFSREERQLLGIHGLFPAVVKSEDEQIKHCVLLLDRYENDLDKFIYLMGLYVSHMFICILSRSKKKTIYISFVIILGS